jgi:hypothetical protein
MQCTFIGVCPVTCVTSVDIVGGCYISPIRTGDRGDDRPEPEVCQDARGRICQRKVPCERDHEAAGEDPALYARLQLYKHTTGKCGYGRLCRSFTMHECATNGPNDNSTTTGRPVVF